MLRTRAGGVRARRRRDHPGDDLPRRPGAGEHRPRHALRRSCASTTASASTSPRSSPTTELEEIIALTVGDLVGHRGGLAATVSGGGLTVATIRVNGLDVHVQRLGHRRSTLPRPVVVLIHGLLIDSLASYYFTPRAAASPRRAWTSSCTTCAGTADHPAADRLPDGGLRRATSTACSTRWRSTARCTWSATPSAATVAFGHRRRTPRAGRQCHRHRGGTAGRRAWTRRPGRGAGQGKPGWSRTRRSSGCGRTRGSQRPGRPGPPARC